MTSPTRQEIIKAHEALLELSGLAEELAVTEVETRQAWKYHAYILAALPPRPQPTMADVEWDNDKHYLAEAEHPYFGKVIMLGEGPLSGCIRITRFKENSGPKNHALWQIAESETLTLTGRRYTLTEVQDD